MREILASPHNRSTEKGGCRRLLFAVVGAIALVGASIVPVGAAAGSSAAGITARLPSSATVGTAVRVVGRVSHAPASAEAELEGAGAGGRWTVLATSRVRRGSFAVIWTPRTGGFLQIRVVVVAKRRRIASTTASTIAVGAAPIRCAAPPPAGRLPAGDGYIVGGVYDVGGPAPGITVCVGQSNTVSVAGAGGAIVATQAVAAGASYRFVVPAGTYTLAAGFCRGSATVRVGAATTADTVCPVP